MQLIIEINKFFCNVMARFNAWALIQQGVMQLRCLIEARQLPHMRETVTTYETSACT